jgi:hypothetical protein
MNNKKTIFALIFLIFLIFIINDKSLAYHNDDYSKNLDRCYPDNKIPGSDSNPNWTYINENVLKPQGIPQYNVDGKRINASALYYRHIVAYGNPHGDLDTKDTGPECVKQKRRYLGYTYDGYDLSEPFFSADFGTRKSNNNWVIGTDHVRKPWENSYLVNHGNNSSGFPTPRLNSHFFSSTAEREKALDNAIDAFSLETFNNGHGYFKEKHLYWCQYSNGNLYQRDGGDTKCPSGTGVTFTGKYLKDFASFETPPTTYSPGLFNMYIRDKTGACWSGYCYGVFVIPQMESPFDFDHDIAADLVGIKTTYENEIISGDLEIKNLTPRQKEIYYHSGCSTDQSNETWANCKSNKSTKLRIHVKNKSTNEVIFDEDVRWYSNLGSGTQININLENYNISPKVSGQYEIIATLPEYIDHDKKPEKSYANNVARKTFDFVAKQDVSIELVLSKNTFKNEQILGYSTLRNNWSSLHPLSISSPCDNSGTPSEAQCNTSNRYYSVVVKSVDDGSILTNQKNHTFNSIKTGNSERHYFKDNYNIFPKKTGEYEIEISIPQYKGHQGQKETSYTNNVVKDRFNYIAEHDASVLIDLAKSEYKDEIVTGNVRISNNWSASHPLSISSPCDTLKKATEAQCKGSIQTGELLVVSVKDSEIIHKGPIEFNGLSRGGNLSLNLADYNITPKNSGTHTIKVTIPSYKDDIDQSEVTYNNNTHETTFEAVVSQNMSVEVTGETTYRSKDTLTNVIEIFNDTTSAKSGDLELTILDPNNNLIESVNKRFTNIAVGSTLKYDLADDDISLSANRYRIKAEITKYSHLPETSYTDNEHQLEITVNPYVPSNTKCEEASTDHTDTINSPYGGDPVTKTCIGWTPNFPSTTIEGGQGTYFYVAYKLFPTPMPVYKVTSHDTTGLNQSYELAEPNNKMGACDMSIAADPKCELYEPFVYYPSTWESRFSDPQYLDLVGPYTVGPHDYHHYRYRGRLMPKEVTFDFSVVDMRDNENIPLANGSLVYDVPDSCYRTDVIDLEDECRLIQFYVPSERATSNLKVPEDSSALEVPNETIQLPNPGKHHFRLNIKEEQVYLYQTDEGAEWQGSKNPSDGDTHPGPVKTHTTSGNNPIKWDVQESYDNQCLPKSSNPSETECSHNHGKDYHYWEFNWSNVKKFGNDGFVN